MIQPRHPRILVIGDLMIDRYLEGGSERVSPEAPVVVVDVQQERSVLGGAGNVAANLKALEAEVVLLGVVGQDANAQAMQALLSAQGIMAALGAQLIVDASRPTTVKTRIIAMHKQVMRFDQEARHGIAGVIAEQLIEAVEQTLPSVALLIVSDYAKGVLTTDLCQQVIARARAVGKPVLVDPKGTDFQKYRGATLVKPNRKELELATGGSKCADLDELVQRAEQLRQDCVLDSLLVTMSEDGMLVLQADRPQTQIRTQAREVFDVTGAGDTVLAALAYSLAQGHTLVQAAEFANTAAAVVVSKMGSATVTHREIMDFHIRHGQRTHNKICALPDLLEQLKILRQAGKTIVFTNGCFDLLHAGHVQYLNAARALGDVLVVGLNTDASVRRLKGDSRPINAEADRAAVLAGLQAVDFVVGFGEDTPLQLIQAVLPDVLVKGSDYEVAQIVGAADVIAAGGRVQTLDFLPGRSSSAMIERAQLD
jgi:D-beta-D-heptose 7-phosphate kinase/D-beta-D-heptose 1-phosphate adenosyltransferase